MSLLSEISSFRENELREMHETERFFYSLSLQAAVEYAASGVTPHRKIHPHQRGIGVKQLRRSAVLMKKHIAAIRRARTFAHLLTVTETVKTDLKGLGDLWSYDTALRIAYNRGNTFLPKAIMIQRTVIKGVKKVFPKFKAKERTLQVKVFPGELQTLKPHELQNFLILRGKEKLNDIH